MQLKQMKTLNIIDNILGIYVLVTKVFKPGANPITILFDTFQNLVLVLDKIWCFMVHQHPSQFLSAGESYDNPSQLKVEYLLKSLIEHLDHLLVGLLSDSSLLHSVHRGL